MPTFGGTSSGSQNDEIFGGFKYASAYAIGVNGWVQKLTLDVDGLGSGTGSTDIAGVIYADSAGSPGALVAVSSTVTIADSAVRAAVDLPFPGLPSVPTGTYWLGVVQVGGASQSARYWANFASGHGRRSAGGASNPFAPSATLDEDIAIVATYQTTAPNPRVTITAPADGATVQDVATLSFTVAEMAPHHIQPQFSTDGGLTWLPLSAECKTSLSAFFNTRRFGNGTLKLRCIGYLDARSTAIGATSSVVTVTVANAVGAQRTAVAGVTTISAAIAACSAGDVLLLSGDFADELSTITLNKANLTIKALDSATPPTWRSRLVIASDGNCFENLIFASSGARTSPEPHGKAAWFYRCETTNAAAGIAAQDGGTIPFDADGAFDTMWQECVTHDVGNRSTEFNQAHGLYAQNGQRLFVYDSVYYRCAARCIQLYPQALEATVDRCALYDSEMGVNIGGDTSNGAGMGDADPNRVFKTSHATIRRSIIGKGGGLDSTTSDGLVYANWGHGVGAGTDNNVADCFLHDPPVAGGGAGLYIDTRNGGITDAGGNITGLSPGYTDPTNGNFRLVKNAAAAGYGPTWLQPLEVLNHGRNAAWGGSGHDELSTPLAPVALPARASYWGGS